MNLSLKGRNNLISQKIRAHGNSRYRPGWDKAGHRRDRKSTRLNSSHVKISYAVFCLKKKKKTERPLYTILSILYLFFATPSISDIYTLSLHDALPISVIGDFDGKRLFI